VKLSVIVPAYNEEKLIGRCLASIHDALVANARAGLETELIVADNNSTDRTAELARAAGANVVFEPVNQISRARNAGAAAATGDWFLFVDADSFPSAGLIGATIDVMERGGVVGGGSEIDFGPFAWWARPGISLLSVVMRLWCWAAGSYIFCRADAFRAAGGFSLELYVSEEIDLSKRMKQYGRTLGLRFVILRGHPLLTSARKLDLYGPMKMLKTLFYVLFNPRRGPRDKRGLGLWYDGKR